MNKLGAIIALLAAIVVWSPLAGGADQQREVKEQEKEQEKIISLAVLDFTAEGGIKEGESRLLTQKFTSSLQKTKIYKIMTRTEINTVMKEQNFQLTDAVLETDRAAEFGRLLKVRQIITGQMGKVGSTYVVILHVIDVESGEELKTIDRAYRGEVDQLLGVMNELAYEIAGVEMLEEEKEARVAVQVSSNETAALGGNELAAFVKGEQITGEGPFYTKCNIWYERPDRISCINYQRGTMIPAGTQVTEVRWGEGRRSATQFSFKRAKDGMVFTINFAPGFHPKVTIAAFRDRLFSRKPLSFWTGGLSQGELDAIKKGVHQPGMSKKAVLITYGFPPEHKTPTLQTPRWIYWTTRFGAKAVEFDPDGRTR